MVVVDVSNLGHKVQLGRTQSIYACMPVYNLCVDGIKGEEKGVGLLYQSAIEAP